MGETAVSKFTPTTLILLTRPAVAVVKVMVTETLVALTLLERAIDGLTSAALNTWGIKTEATLSNTVPAAVKVVIVQVEAAAAF